VAGIKFEKSMKWNQRGAFSRPALAGALFGEQVVPFEYAG
jgi:glycyl-tRNA synthetase beta subunit